MMVAGDLSSPASLLGSRFSGTVLVPPWEPGYE